MRLIWLWFIAGIVLWPIHSTVATVGDKPIDMMFSDALIFLIPVSYIFIRTTPTREQCQFAKAPILWYSLTPTLALICVLYMTAVAGIGLGLSGETVRVFSAFKLAKPVGFVLLGLMLGSWTDPIEFIDIFSRGFGVLTGLTFFFTLTEPNFPLGEWGKYIFEYELSG